MSSTWGSRSAPIPQRQVSCVLAALTSRGQQILTVQAVSNGLSRPVNRKPATAAFLVLTRVSTGFRRLPHF